MYLYLFICRMPGERVRAAKEGGAQNDTNTTRTEHSTQQSPVFGDTKIQRWDWATDRLTYKRISTNFGARLLTTASVVVRRPCICIWVCVCICICGCGWWSGAEFCVRQWAWITGRGGGAIVGPSSHSDDTESDRASELSETELSPWEGKLKLIHQNKYLIFSNYFKYSFKIYTQVIRP